MNLSDRVDNETLTQDATTAFIKAMENATCMIPLTDAANVTFTVANVTSTVANVTSTVANISSTIANLVSTVANVTSTVANVTSTVANATSTVTNVTSTVTSVTATVTNVTSTVTNVTSTVTNVTSIAANVTDMGDIYPPYVIAFLYFFFTMIIVMNVPSVFIVVVSLFRNIDLKNSQVLLSLSITDMLFGVCCVVVINSNLTSDKISYKECLLRYTISFVSYSVSNIHVFCISLERVCKICIRMNIFTKNRKMCSLLSVFLSWAFTGTFIALVLIFMSKDNGEEECSLSRIVPKEFPFIPIMAITIQVGTIINILILAIFLFRHHRQMQKLKMLKVGTDDVRLCITVTIISAVCTILHMPWVILRIYETLVESQPQLVRNTAFLFAAFPSIINPIIYIFRIQKFRQLLLNSINTMC